MDLSPEEIITQIQETYQKIKSEITQRLSEFEAIWNSFDEKAIFVELSFCLLTPQSKAVSAAECIKNLLDKKLLWTADADAISEKLNLVRFKNNKAKYIVENREKLKDNGKFILQKTLMKFPDIFEKRLWLVKNIKGMGVKEASHFLRNVGLGEELAILDRHVLKYMAALGLIKEMPKTLSQKKYFELEQLLLKFAKDQNIRPDYLDMVLWYLQAGKVFK